MRSFITDALICILLGLCMLLMTSAYTYAQNVGINNPVPHNKSMLDITSTDKGFLAPRMTQVQRIAMFAAADISAKGMLVYQIDNAEGFYYFDGNAWHFLGATGTDWNLTGNAGTNPSSNFIGTTDATGLSVRTNNTDAIRVTEKQYVGIGTNTPVRQLDVAGHINVKADSTYRINNTAVVATPGGTNTMLGQNAGISNTGVWNTFTGYYSGANTTSAINNSMYGGNSGFFNTTGANNAFFGNGSGFQNTIGNQNTCIGMEAGKNNTSGSFNTNLGSYAGYNTNTGSLNTYVGYNSKGLSNLNNAGAIGANAFSGVNNSMVIGDTSVRVGIGNSYPAYPMSFQDKVGDKISLFGGAGNHYGFGVQAYLLQVHAANSWDDIGFGYGTSEAFNEKVRIKGNGKVGIGTKTPGSLYSYVALEVADSTGLSKDVMLRSSSNTHSSLLFARTRGNMTSPSVILAGDDLGRLSGMGYDGSKLMTAAEIQFHVDSIPGSDKMPGNITFHTASSTSGFTPLERMRINRNGFVGIGTSFPQQTLDINGNMNVLNDSNYRIGNVRMLSAKGNANTFVGKNAGIANTGGFNAFIGYQAGSNNVTGSYNTFLGTESGFNNDAGVHNTFIGYKSGYNSLSNNNTFVGWQCGSLTSTGASNTFMGSNAGVQNNTGTGNSFFGNNAGQSTSTGNYNVALGYGSLFQNNAGHHNVAIGNNSGSTNTTGNGNVFIGTNADATQSGLSSAAAIGYNAKVTVSNAIALGQTGTFVGVGFAIPGFPLNFETTTGDKISLFGNSGNHYGFGIQPSLMQIHTAASSEDIAFGYGKSSVFSETMRIKGNGNVGIGTNAPATKLEVNGFTKLGSNAPGVKLLKLTGTSPSAQGGSVSVNHGLTISKILSVTVLIEKSAANFIPPAVDTAGDNYNFQVTSTAIVVTNKTANSANLLSKPVKILVTYEE